MASDYHRPSGASVPPHSPVTVPEVDRLLSRIAAWLEQPPAEAGQTLALSRDDVRWLHSEIEGGREAFGVVVQQKAALAAQVAQMQRTIDDLLAMRGR